MSATVFYNHANELATVRNVFSVAGSPVDPTTITLIVTDPAGTSNSYTFAGGTVTRNGTGDYQKDVSCTSTVDGLWTAVWIGTGAASDVVESRWTTFDTNAKLYCSAEELKSRLGLAPTDTVDDLEIRLAIESISREIDDYCDRHFWRGTSTRTFVPESMYCCNIDDLITVTTLKTDSSGDGTYETTWTTADYQLHPVNASTAHAEARPYTSLKAVGSYTFPIAWSGSLAREDRVEIAGVWGWPAIPSGVKQAALILAAETLKLKEAPFGVLGGGEFGPVRVRDNHKAAKLLGPYRRFPVLVA